MQRIIRAFGHSWRGLCAAFENETAFRQEVVLALVLIPVALIVDVGRTEKLLMISTVLLVLIVELINSAVENVVDRTGPEWHELSGRAKDQGSAAVLVALVLMLWVWLAALWPLFST